MQTKNAICVPFRLGDVALSAVWHLLLDADPENPARNIVSGFELVKG